MRLIENGLKVFVFLDDLWEFSSESGLKVLFDILTVLKYETLNPCDLPFDVISSFFLILLDWLIKALYLPFLSLNFLFSELDKLLKPGYFTLYSFDILFVIPCILSLSST